MSQLLSPLDSVKTMQSLALERRLGRVHINIPDHVGSLDIPLDTLYRTVTGIPGLPSHVNGDDVECICLYGSALYLNHPVPDLEGTKRKYGFFGKKVPYTVRGTRQLPRDVDVMVIMHSNFSDEKVVAAKRNLHDTGYGFVEVVVDGPVPAKRCTWEGYGYVGVNTWCGLHIAYRSKEQFVSGIGSGDELSESIHNHGVPIVGAQQFEELVAQSARARNVQHAIEWSDEAGVLNGQLIPLKE